jgi:hypothetical protein
MFKRNWYLFTPLILIIIPALAWGYYVGVFGYSPAEAMMATRHFFQSSTRYANKYSEDHFNRLVQPGQDGRKVFEAIGVPFERHNDDAEWIYALPNGSTPYYHERKVIFTRDANNVPRVKQKVKSFHTP